ncbi:hypothetical protein [Tumebacillus lipolyticus]|uniref:Uncharacterized protein n=1 Tax=Tumebacillus lipolyticus TaxID=1280370 RepID=A0ABW5A4D6_9BACL
MSKSREQKMIPRRDFIWMCVVFSLVLASVLIWTMGDSDNAGKYLSFAATVVSIVLAVIAIIMPLIDSAGQKQNISQMRDTVEDLEKFAAGLQSTLEQSATLLASVSNLRIELQEKMDEHSDSLQLIAEKIDRGLSASEDKEKAKVLEEIKQDVENVQRHTIMLHDRKLGSLRWEVANYVKKREEGEEFTIHDVFNDLARRLPVFRLPNLNDLYEWLDTFVKQGYLEVFVGHEGLKYRKRPPSK